MKWFWALSTIVFILLVALRAWRYHDEQSLDRVWRSLASTAEVEPARFDSTMLVGLPEPVQRYFTSAISPGTPLYTIAEISMQGHLSLGSKASPEYLPMAACQLLAPPSGFVWHVRAGKGMMRLVGSDAAFPHGSWTRFWMSGVLPVARAGGNTDHALSSFGRYMAEALFWSPASLLPSDAVKWEETGPDQARVTIVHENLQESFDLIIDKAGHPVQVSFQRWSDANEDKIYRRQPFGGYLSDFKNFEGYQLPTTIAAGNHFGTDAYFPFFKVHVDSVRLIKNHDSKRLCEINR